MERFQGKHYDFHPPQEEVLPSEMLIYIRHGEDAHEPGVTKKHDTPLTARGEYEAGKTAIVLQRRFGTPDLIYCSPYMRAIQTAEKMSKALGVCVPTIVDSALSKYVTRGNLRELDVRYETLIFDPPIYETMDVFKSRVHQQYCNMISKFESPAKTAKSIPLAEIQPRKIWLVTHGIFVKCVALDEAMVGSPNQIGSCEWVNATAKEYSWSRTVKARRAPDFQASSTHMMWDVRPFPHLTREYVQNTTDLQPPLPPIKNTTPNGGDLPKLEHDSHLIPVRLKLPVMSRRDRTQHGLPGNSLAPQRASGAWSRDANPRSPVLDIKPIFPEKNGTTTVENSDDCGSAYPELRARK